MVASKICITLMFLGSVSQLQIPVNTKSWVGMDHFALEAFKCVSNVSIKDSMEIKSYKQNIHLSAFWTASKTQKLWVGFEYVDLWPAVLVFDVPRKNVTPP